MEAKSSLDIKEKMKETGDFVEFSRKVVNHVNNIIYSKFGDELEHEPVKNQDIWRSCIFCSGSQTLCFNNNQLVNFRTSEITHCKRCNVVTKYEFYYILLEERHQKLKSVLK